MPGAGRVLDCREVFGVATGSSMMGIRWGASGVN